MPRTGRPPTPTEVKRRRGTLRKDRDPGAALTVLPMPAVQASADVPEFADGRDMLQGVLDAGARTWIGPTDTPVAELARQLWDDRTAARLAWQALPMDPALFRAYDELTKRLTTCLSQLGLDPASRARLGVAEVKVRSKLEELADRRHQRLQAGRPGS